MADIFQRIMTLKQAPIFSAVYTEDLRVLAQILDEEMFFSGDLVFEINDPSDKVYFIETGKVGISIDPDPDNKTFIAELGPNDCFGEMGMFDEQPRSATAHVLEDSKLLVLDKTRLRTMITRHPELGLGMLRTMSERLREANRQSISPQATEYDN